MWNWQDVELAGYGTNGASTNGTAETVNAEQQALENAIAAKSASNAIDVQAGHLVVTKPVLFIVPNCTQYTMIRCMHYSGPVSALPNRVAIPTQHQPEAGPAAGN